MKSLKYIISKLTVLILRMINLVVPRLRKRGSVTILMLHNIPGNMHKKFDDLIQGLHATHKFIQPDEFDLFMKNKLSFHGNRILLTFDDGFYSNYVAAKQVLDPLGIKGIFFIPVGFIDSIDNNTSRSFAVNRIHHGVHPTGYSDEDLKPMSWDDIYDLVEGGHKIGGHTQNHASLSEITDDEVMVAEIIQAGDKLESKINRQVNHFAYPFGGIQYISQKAFSVAQMRFPYIHSGVRGTNTTRTNPFALRREAINIFDDIDYIKDIIDGSLALFYLRTRKKLDSYLK